MKRALSKRRESKSADQTAAKRLKRYSTRDYIPWDEQRLLGGKFEAVGEGSWPVRRIVGEKGPIRKKQYLIEWESHPITLEDFRPQWRSHLDVGDDLIREWQSSRRPHESEKLLPASRPAVPDSSFALPRDRQALNLDVDLDVDVDLDLDLDQASDVLVSPPSLLSDSSASALEILETQYLPVPESLTVNIPTLPDEKADYDSVHSSQYSPTNATFDYTSTESRLTFTSHQSGASWTNHQPENSGQSNSNFTHPSPARVPRRLQSSPRLFSKTKHTSPKVGPSSSSSTSTQIHSPYALKRGVVDQNQADSIVVSVPSASDPSSRLASPFRDSPPSRLTHTSQTTSLQSKKRPARRALTSAVHFNPSAITYYDRTKPRQSALEKAPIATNSLSNTFTMTSQTLDPPSIDPAEVHAKSPLVNNITLDDFDVDDALLNHSINEGQISVADTHLIPLMIHESIEDEPQSSTDTSQLIDSKLNSSQESLNNEREIETFDGVMIPARPMFGLNEYAVALPAEGKVKSMYDEIIKLKKKAIVRFIERTGSPGTSAISHKKTNERNEMQEMLQRLNETTTHTDLGLPGMQSQYSLNSEQNAAYADYAGSKFTMLGYLVDQFKTKPGSFAIFSQEGPLQELLEEFLRMKHVNVRRYDRPREDQIPDELQSFSVDLITTQSGKVITLPQKPAFILSFDVSFSTSDPQMQNLHQSFGEDLPIIHLLVTNSSEHVERCVPISFTSNIRLKVVVRTTYLASPNLGGEITYVPDPSDHPAEDRPMDMSDIQRAVRKSPARRMALIADIISDLVSSGDFNANWSLGGMPELKLAPLRTPPKSSRAASRTPQPRVTRGHTPASRATTPVGRKRLLESDGENGSKRQRLTPARDLPPSSQPPTDTTEELYQARKQIAYLGVELGNIQKALNDAKDKQAVAEAKGDEWRESHAELLRRFEKGRVKQRVLQKENKKLNATVLSLKERDEGTRTEKAGLRQQLTELRSDLTQAREDLKAGDTTLSQLEHAREEARNATAKMQALEKSLKTMKGDFEFTRIQYQDASKHAADRASEVQELELQVEKLKPAADDSKRSLKAMNYQMSLNKFMDRAEQFKLEVKAREAVIKRLQEENAGLKSRRGVQTRGSSVQPASSPGPRSRQASPASGHLMPPSGSRASVLRNER